MLCSAKSIAKIESLHKRVFFLVVNDYEIPREVLLEDSRKSTMTLTHSHLIGFFD